MAYVMDKSPWNVTAVVVSYGGGMVRIRLWEMINTETDSFTQG
jgi:hypothetical protein